MVLWEWRAGVPNSPGSQEVLQRIYTEFSLQDKKELASWFWSGGCSGPVAGSPHTSSGQEEAEGGFEASSSSAAQCLTVCDHLWVVLSYI